MPNKSRVIEIDKLGGSKGLFKSKENWDNQGKLILDATCTPADISYPTDLRLLNQAREYTEKILDKLYQQVKELFERKPRTYRIQARKDYLEVAKQRRPKKNKRRKAIRKQLAYLRRNLSSNIFSFMSFLTLRTKNLLFSSNRFLILFLEQNPRNARGLAISECPVKRDRDIPLGTRRATAGRSPLIQQNYEK